jgi:hypothetical protein
VRCMSFIDNIEQWIKGLSQETRGKMHQEQGGLKGGLQGTADRISGKINRESAEAKMRARNQEDRDLSDGSIW